MRYIILWIQACMATIDAHLLQQQGRMDLVGEALNQRYRYEREMSHIRLNKRYGGLR
jgi:hypothetical protein